MENKKNNYKTPAVMVVEIQGRLLNNPASSGPGESREHRGDWNSED